MNHRLAAFACLAILTVTAQADVVGTVKAEGGRIDLHNEPGICVADALRASYVPSRGEPVGGCWVTSNGVVLVVFLDGDIARIPVLAIKAPDKT
jgi:hypothetical protein